MTTDLCYIIHNIFGEYYYKNFDSIYKYNEEFLVNFIDYGFVLHYLWFKNPFFSRAVCEDQSCPRNLYATYNVDHLAFEAAFVDYARVRAVVSHSPMQRRKRVACPIPEAMPKIK